MCPFLHRDGGLSVNFSVECQSLIAGKPRSHRVSYQPEACNNHSLNAAIADVSGRDCKRVSQ